MRIPSHYMVISWPEELSNEDLTVFFLLAGAGDFLISVEIRVGT